VLGIDFSLVKINQLEIFFISAFMKIVKISLHQFATPILAAKKTERQNKPRQKYVKLPLLRNNKE